MSNQTYKSTPRRGNGRGSSKISRKNLLKGIPADAFVFNRNSFIGDWEFLDGPMPFHKAHAAANRLEEKNSTGKQLYAAQRLPELVELSKKIKVIGSTLGSLAEEIKSIRADLAKQTGEKI